MRIIKRLQDWRRHTEHPRLLLALIGGLTLLIRLWMVSHTYIIAKDGILYVSAAQHFSALELRAGLALNYPPLYPLLIASAHILIRDWELAGQMVSALFGSLTMVPLFHLARRLFNTRAALLTCLLLAVHPYFVRISAEVLSDATYIFSLLSSVALSWKCLEEGKSQWGFLAGLSCAAAYLTRPEGIGVLFVVLPWVFFLGILGKRPLPVRRILYFSFSLVLSFLLLASPYLLYLRQEMGMWQLTKKKHIKTILGLEDVPTHYQKKFKDQGGKPGQ